MYVHMYDMNDPYLSSGNKHVWAQGWAPIIN